MSKSKIQSRLENIPAWLIIGTIVILSVVRLVIIFSQRNGHHVDETWSYGFANSYYSPYIYTTTRYGGFEESYWKNIGVWTDGKEFKDYLTVSKDNAFSFDSVMYNKEYDLNPPLYDLILHFICSFFPDKFSWTYAFVISLLFYIPSLVFVYLISVELTDSRFVGYITTIYYVLSGCGTANFLYLRVYHISTFLTLCLFWLVIKIIKYPLKKHLIMVALLPLVTMAGAFNQYFFLVIAFFITLFGELLLLFKKQVKKFFVLGPVMLISVILYFVCYPTAFGILFPYSTGESGGVPGYAYPYSWNLAVANRHFFSGTIGWFIDFSIPDIIAFGGIVVFVSLVVILFCFLFRNEKFLKNFKNTLSVYLKKILCASFAELKKLDIAVVIALISSLLCIFVIPKVAKIYNMYFVERYFFASMTLFIVAVLSCFGVFIKRMLTCNEHRILLFLLIALLVVSNIKTNYFTEGYKFNNMNEEELLRDLTGKDVYVYTAFPRDLVWLSSVLMNSENIFIDIQASLEPRDYNLPYLDSECLIMVNTNFFMSDEQKSEYSYNGTVVGEVGDITGLMETEEDFIDRVETQTGYEYSFIGQYQTFVGVYNLYKAV